MLIHGYLLCSPIELRLAVIIVAMPSIHIVKGLSYARPCIGSLMFIYCIVMMHCKWTATTAPSESPTEAPTGVSAGGYTKWIDNGGEGAYYSYNVCCEDVSMCEVNCEDDAECIALCTDPKECDFADDCEFCDAWVSYFECRDTFDECKEANSLNYLTLCETKDACNAKAYDQEAEEAYNACNDMA